MPRRPGLERREDAHAQLPQAVDAGYQFVTRLGCAYACGSAGENDVARLQRVILRQERDLLGHAPDHLVDVRLLAQFAVYLEPEFGLGWMPQLACRGDRPAGRGLVEVLAEAPRPALVFALLLQVAPGHVQPDRITPDVV